MNKWIAVAVGFLGWAACTVPNDDPLISVGVQGSGGGGAVDAAVTTGKKDASAGALGGFTGGGGSTVAQTVDAATLPDVALPNTGGMEVPTSIEVSVSNTGGTPPPPPPPPAPPPPPPMPSPPAPLMDSTRFNFESNTQGWVDLGVGNTREAGIAPVVSMDRAFRGSQSLKYSVIVADANKHERLFGVVGSKIGELPAGKTISFQVWVPTGHKLETLSAFVQTRVGGSWKSDDRRPSQFTANAWTQLNIPIPQSYLGQEPLELGLRLVFSGPWTGDVYVDSVNVQ